MSATYNFSAANILSANIEGIEIGLAISMVKLQKEMRVLLSTKGTGVGYRGGRKHKGNFRTRSSPGQPPAIDTGALHRSVQTKPEERKTDKVISIVMTGLVAGIHKDARIPRWLEFGTSKGLAERPFIRPSLKVVEPIVQKTIEEQMQKAIKRMRNSIVSGKK